LQRAAVEAQAIDALAAAVLRFVAVIRSVGEGGGEVVTEVSVKAAARRGIRLARAAASGGAVFLGRVECGASGSRE
jgi:hypothetical protein